MEGCSRLRDRFGIHCECDKCARARQEDEGGGDSSTQTISLTHEEAPMREEEEEGLGSIMGSSRQASAE